mmetsp:Transcript_12791/g.31099  ORF Transcript_12791/g.31099 Transcript_12791/m.31099 type:complete len:249 (+) Transcript_12791:571-1317(+)
MTRAASIPSRSPSLRTSSKCFSRSPMDFSGLSAHRRPRFRPYLLGQRSLSSKWNKFRLRRRRPAETTNFYITDFEFIKYMLAPGSPPRPLPLRPSAKVRAAKLPLQHCRAPRTLAPRLLAHWPPRPGLLAYCRCPGTASVAVWTPRTPRTIFSPFRAGGSSAPPAYCPLRVWHTLRTSRKGRWMHGCPLERDSPSETFRQAPCTPGRGEKLPSPPKEARWPPSKAPVPSRDSSSRPPNGRAFLRTFRG